METANNSANPVWNYRHVWTDCKKISKIVFKVFYGHDDAILGAAELDLSDAAAGVLAGLLSGALQGRV